MLRGQAGDLATVLDQRVAAAPQRTAVRFLREGEDETDAISYQALQARAACLASHLADAQPAGSRILLLFDAGIEFIAAFWACMQAGMVAVPAPLPRTNRSVSWYEHVVSDAGIKCMLVGPGLRQRIDAAFAASPVLHALDCIVEDGSGGQLPPAAVPDDTLAFLQYTSGSTGAPKGVMVSHRNLLANQAGMQSIWHTQAGSVIASWLPHFHDMGLIGKIIHSLYTGATLVLMPPSAFIQRPARWLNAISRHRACNSGAPNFAYEMCLHDVDDALLASLDLSCWQVAWNGAEPVRAQTLHAFLQRFARCGLRSEALIPSYGLAEGTLIVSTASPGPAQLLRLDATALQDGRVAVLERAQVDGTASPLDAAARWAVSCGRCLPEHGLRIVDPNTRRLCEPGKVGEIWFSGPSATRGYWRQEDASREACQARIDSDPQNVQPHVRTGDLGFVAVGDQVFIVGRLKDMLVIRGANHAPQDIERSVATCDPAFMPDACAAFSVVADGEERLVIVQELRRSASRCAEGPLLLRRVRERVAADHGLQPFALCLIQQAHLPKTTSGKVQRRLCRTLFLEHRLQSIFMWCQGEVDPQQPLVTGYQNRRYGNGREVAGDRPHDAAEAWLMNGSE